MLCSTLNRYSSRLCYFVFTEEAKHYTSSSRGNTKVLQLKMIEDVVLNLMEEEDAWPFLRPVVKKDVSTETLLISLNWIKTINDFGGCIIVCEIKSFV